MVATMIEFTPGGYLDPKPFFKYVKALPYGISCTHHPYTPWRIWYHDYRRTEQGIWSVRT